MDTLHVLISTVTHTPTHTHTVWSRGTALAQLTDCTRQWVQYTRKKQRNARCPCWKACRCRGCVRSVTSRFPCFGQQHRQHHIRYALRTAGHESVHHGGAALEQHKPSSLSVATRECDCHRRARPSDSTCTCVLQHQLTCEQLAPVERVSEQF